MTRLRAQRHDGGAIVAVLVLVLCLAAGLGYLLLLGHEPQAPADPEAPAPSAASEHDVSWQQPNQVPGKAPPLPPLPPSRAPDEAEVASGTISGTVQVDPALRGKVSSFSILIEEAANVDVTAPRGTKIRRFEQAYQLADGQASASFELHHVPFSVYGWSICCLTPGLNGSEEVVPLDAQRPSARVMLTLRPAVAVHLVVKDQERQPLSEVPIVLTPVGRPNGRRVLSGTTDSYGLVLHDKVVRGGYELLVGTAQQPLLPVRQITVGEDGDHYEKIELPRGGDARFRVLNPAGVPLDRVQVRAIGQEQRMGRPLDLETDKDGRVALRHLSPGRYHIHFAKKGFKRGYEKIDVDIHTRIEKDVLLDYDFGR